MITEQVSNSYIYYDETPTFYIRDYYNYIIFKLKNVILNCNVNIIVGNYSVNFHNSNKTFKVHINYEHTLVKPGGRDSQGHPSGSIPILDSDQLYLIRLVEKDNAFSSDICIDYSIPNIVNLRSNSTFNTISQKTYYLAPTLYPLQCSKNINRSINILTTFINTNEPRRRLLLDTIQSNSMSHININNCFDKNTLQDLYLDTKVIINIHQTDHHHTFEELRVLPALLCGVLVICEESPLKEYIPYKDFVIWCKYEDIIKTTVDVLVNYDRYYDSIFSTPASLRLQEMLGALDKDIYSYLSKALHD